MLKERNIWNDNINHSKRSERGRQKQRSGVEHKKNKVELQISTYITFKEVQCLLKKEDCIT